MTSGDNIQGDTVAGDSVGGDKVLGNQTNVNTGSGGYIFVHRLLMEHFAGLERGMTE